MALVKINRYTRAAVKGKEIYCPYCEQKAIVFHFSWFSLVCQHCDKEVRKYQWSYEK